jgi:hypothetical protein
MFLFGLDDHTCRHALCIVNGIEQATPLLVNYLIPPTLQHYGIDRQRRVEAVMGRLATMVTLLLLLGVYTLIASQPS